ncbi:MAG: glutamate ligase domain-containing protein [Lacipirellulaceae bacterium]
MLYQTRAPKRLRSLLPAARFFPEAADPVGTIVRLDPSTIRPGDLYVHLAECDATGAEWAAERGAAAVIAERLLPGLPAPMAVVSDARDAHRVLENAFAGDTTPVHAPLVGVVGTMGRSTTAHLVAACFAAAGRKVGLWAGDVVDDSRDCHPQKPLGFRGAARDSWLTACFDAEADLAVFAATPNDRLAPLALSAACVTTLRADGLDSLGKRRFESPQVHRQAVQRSLERLAQEATLAVPTDDPDALALASRHTGRVVTYGDDTHADVAALVVDQHAGGQSFIVTRGDESACCVVGRPGDAYRAACLAAVATACGAGISLMHAIEGLETAPPREGYAESVGEGQSFSVLVDRAFRPLALRGALATTRSLATGNVFAVLRLSTDEAVAAQQLAVAARLADRTLVTGVAVAGDGCPENITFVDDRVAAVAVALGLAESGDAVLVAGSGPAALARDRRLVTALLHKRNQHEEASRR